LALTSLALTSLPSIAAPGRRSDHPAQHAASTHGVGGAEQQPLAFEQFAFVAEIEVDQGDVRLVAEVRHESPVEAPVELQLTVER